ncbi:RNase H domain-containing protein [Colletotrichum orchidophilum]|uniref:ribonuclease H n=1 Tax=Colletotrichum orchidophilum TaxID=1209926 RepID=A0A1G4B2V2_9PEZI|nr:RNase H domain-containing protein [Colletotrichum orchidophilum]OHE95632.1 RNase H domain-containing protein [Colletotrichum orchidophilum]
MTWPDIDRVDLPNGRTITVCAPHHMVTCGRCCLDFSHEFDEEKDDDELFGFDYNSPVPRDVSFAQVANSRYGRLKRAIPSGPRGSARFRPTWTEDEDSDGPLPLVDDLPSTGRMGEDQQIFFGTPAFDRIPKRTQFSGTLFPTNFGQQKEAPLEPSNLFPPCLSMKAVPPVLRFINRYDTSEALIYTDGACFDNGDAAARGGSAFIFKPVSPNDESGRVAFKLEDKGPDGQTYRHTSNRAELRAALAALRYRAWYGEGFKSIVIATDSTYVVNGATDWAHAWIKKGWRTSSGERVKNRDLWEALLLRAEVLHDHGVNVRFWWIPRKFNHEADKAAKSAASSLEPMAEFGDLIGILD